MCEVKNCKSPINYQIREEIFQAEGETLLHEIHELFHSIFNKEQLPDYWKEFIIVLIYQMSDKTDCSNYRGIPMLSTSYKMFSNIILLSSSPYIDEIVEDHQCGF
jgi:hypothetical protein